MNKYEQNLDKNKANFVPLTPLSFLERAKDIYPNYEALIYEDKKFTWKEIYKRCIKFASALEKIGIGEGDTGKNTGGMGCYSPSRLFSPELEKKINTKIIEPTLKAIKELGTIYRGFLYVGLMIKDQNPYLVEFNVRMGDPECQTILPLLNDDLVEIFINCCLGKLTKDKIILSEKKSICIVLCSKGYPDNFKRKS